MLKRVAMFVCLCLCWGSVWAASPALSVEGAWLRATPAGAEVGAGYAVLRNVSDQPVRVVSIRSSVAESVEVHSMTMEGGVMRMRMLDSLTIPAKGTVTLEPGGFHLMLMGLHAPLKAGQTVKLKFKLANGRTLSVTAPVRDPSP